MQMMQAPPGMIPVQAGQPFPQQPFPGQQRMPMFGGPPPGDFRGMEKIIFPR